MGGEPMAVLNCAGFPPNEDKDLLREILRGGADKVREAGAVVAGGHSVRDDDLKFGMAVIGKVHPDEVITNAGARVGDKLVLTKAIGTGTMSTARKKDAITEAEFQPAVKSMLELNRAAGRAMADARAHAATDVTGFGLFGHALEMACASRVTIAIDFSAIPLLPLARECAEKGLVPGGAKNNLAHFEPLLAGVFPDPAAWALAFDPQTSGGLLIAIGPDRLDQFLGNLQGRGHTAALVGEVIEESEGRLVIR